MGKLHRALMNFQKILYPFHYILHSKRRILGISDLIKNFKKIMVASINQPAYLPWLGYFDRIIKSDIHIILDDVQFEKNSFINRNKIVTDINWTWLTVPVQTKGKFGNLEIKDLKIDNTSKWRKKHYNSLNYHYGKSKYFGEHKNWFKNFMIKNGITYTHY